MLDILMSLQPRQEFAGTVLFEELQEINEILFISKGICDVGFEINKLKKYVLRFTDKVVVGAYNCTFRLRAIFCYRCKTDCEGYSIRK